MPSFPHPPLPRAFPQDSPFRTQRRPGLLMVVGLGHVALFMALATVMSQPRLSALITPLSVSLIEATERTRIPAPEPALPRHIMALPAAPALPVPAVTSEPASPTPPTRPAPEPSSSTQAASLHTAAAEQEGPSIRVDAAPPATPPAVQPKRLAASAVQYRVMPPAEVPRTSRRAGESGTVWLRVLVDTEGVPRSVTLQRSSGFARLDEQALWAMRQARFTPHREDGRPVEVEVIAPIEYPPG